MRKVEEWATGLGLLGMAALILLPAPGRASSSHATACKNRLRMIALAAQMYADDHHGRFPWAGPDRRGQEEATEEDALASLALLYRYDYLDDPKIFICPATSDSPAPAIEDRDERLRFRFEPGQCSFTFRNRLTTVNDDSKTPIAGDKHTIDHDDLGEWGRHVVYKGGNVSFLPSVKWWDPDSREAERPRAELIRFHREPVLR